MKVSMDHFFSSCSGCPFVKKDSHYYKGGPYPLFCRLMKDFVEGNNIPENCPLKKDEEEKVYKIYAQDIQ